MYTIIFSRAASKHKSRLARSGLEGKAKEILNILAINPYQNPPPYEKLVGNFKGAYSRRINRQHRVVYQVDEERQAVFILSMWTHYE